MLQKADSWKLSASQTWLSQFFLSFLIFLCKNTNWHFYAVFNLKSFYESTSEERYRMSLRGQVRKHGRNRLSFTKGIAFYCIFGITRYFKKKIFCRISITKTITIIYLFCVCNYTCALPIHRKGIIVILRKVPIQE